MSKQPKRGEYIKIVPAGITLDRAMEIADAVVAKQAPDVHDPDIIRLWREGKSDVRIATELGVPRSTIRVRRDALGLQPLSGGRPKGS